MAMLICLLLISILLLGNKIFISTYTFHGYVNIDVCNCSFGQNAIKLLKQEINNKCKNVYEEVRI